MKKNTSEDEAKKNYRQNMKKKEENEKLLQTLRNAHAQTADPASRKKITLTKRTTSEIKPQRNRRTTGLV